MIRDLENSPPCLGGVAAASADGVVVRKNQMFFGSSRCTEAHRRQVSPMKLVKPNHPLARPARNSRPNSRPLLQTFRTELRKKVTPAEATLWKYLQRSQLAGRKFRRQHSVGDYILDVYCPSERLATELTVKFIWVIGRKCMTPSETCSLTFMGSRSFDLRIILFLRRPTSYCLE